MADVTDLEIEKLKKMSLQDITCEFQAVAKQALEMREALPKSIARGEALLSEINRRYSFELFGFAPLANAAAPTEEPAASYHAVAMPSGDTAYIPAAACAAPTFQDLTPVDRAGHDPLQPHPSFIDTTFEEPARAFFELPVELPGEPQPASAAGLGAGGDQDSAPEASPAAEPLGFGIGSWSQATSEIVHTGDPEKLIDRMMNGEGGQA
jgi:hypothetical protein